MSYDVPAILSLHGGVKCLSHHDLNVWTHRQFNQPVMLVTGIRYTTRSLVKRLFDTTERNSLSAYQVLASLRDTPPVSNLQGRKLREITRTLLTMVKRGNLIEVSRGQYALNKLA